MSKSINLIMHEFIKNNNNLKNNVEKFEVISNGLYNFTEVTGGYEVRLKDRNLRDAIIPSKYNDIPIVSISEFSNSSITSVTIPDTVTSIGDEAFSNCGKLSTVYFKGPKPIIGSSAFFNIQNNANGYYYQEFANTWSNTSTIDGLTINVIDPPTSILILSIPLILIAIIIIYIVARKKYH